MIKKSINKANKDQYSLDKPAVEISALSSENFGKYEFLAGEDIFPEKGQRKAATIKIFEYSSLGSELKNRVTLEKVSISFSKIK